MSPLALGLVIGGTWMIVGTLVALAFGCVARVGLSDEPPPRALDHRALDLAALRVLDVTPRDLSGIDDDKVVRWDRASAEREL